MKRRIEGVVIAITRNQEGWGDTQHEVGVEVTFEHHLVDTTKADDADDFKELARKSMVTLPWELRGHVAVGEELIIQVGHVNEMRDPLEKGEV